MEHDYSDINMPVQRIWLVNLYVFVCVHNGYMNWTAGLIEICYNEASLQSWEVLRNAKTY